MHLPLSGKRFLVTQSDAFMGPALCAALADQGATVIAHPGSLAEPEAAAQAVAEAGELQGLVANLALAAPNTPAARARSSSSAARRRCAA